MFEAMRGLGLPLRPLRRRLIEPVAARWRAWWTARLPPQDTLQLTQRNIYIVPTRAGLMFAVTLIVLLVASINYQLNLGYVLTFLLAGSGAMSMHITHNTLRGLRLHLRSPSPAFAGAPVGMEIVLTAPTRGKDHTRHGIGVRVDAAARDSFSWVDVPAGGQTTARVSFVAAHRGWQPMPLLRVETRFPLGLFRAWTLWRPAARVLAWPAPETPPAALPPVQNFGASGQQSARHAEGGDTEGVRAYRRGDPLRLVVWKKFARAGELVSRDTGAAARQQLWLDEPSTGLAEREARLSRIAAWVIEAERHGADYGLRVADRELAPAQGDAHRLACLEALALCP